MGPTAAAMAPPMLPFCDTAQMSTTMYMDGFRSSLVAYLFAGGDFTNIMDDGDNNDNDNATAAAAAPPPCLTFLLKRWTLDTPPKFIGAMVATVLLGLAAEGLAAARTGGGMSRWAHAVAQRCCGCFRGSTNRRRTRTRTRTRTGGRSTTTTTTAAAAASSKCHRRIVQLCVIATHMLQAWVGYVLMLAAMSYSWELLGSALVGLGLGYAACFELDTDHDEEDGYAPRNEEEGEEEGEEEYEELLGGDTEVGEEAQAAATSPYPGRSGGNANPAGNGYAAVGGAGTSTSCCDVAGRGPPRRAFQFLRSPVPTLSMSHRRISPARGDRESGSDGNTNDDDADSDDAEAAAMAMAGHGGGGHNGDGAGNLSLREDDKMTPLL